MKLYDKILLILILFTTNFLISQAPSQFTYQSVVRTNSGSLVSNQEVSFRFTILKGTELGSIVFEEEHTVTTNINGLATMIIGKGSGTDDLSEIDWGIDSYFLKVEVDPEGGFNYIAEDTTQLLSVPFALYSNSSGSNLEITGQDYLSLNNNEITVNKINLSDDVDGILPIANGGTGSSTAPMVAVITALDAAAARNVLGLSTVASSGSYNDLTERLTAGTNIDITNGVISSTDTNTTYTAGTGISIDGSNAISTTVTDTDTVRSVTAGGNTLDDSETLAFTAGSNVTITENAGAVTISSTDTNTEYTAGTGISIDGNNSISTTVTDTDTVRSVTAGGNTLADGETLAFTAGSNVTITENAGAVTISSTDTNTTYSVGDGGLTQNNFTNALKSKLDGLNTPAIYDNSGSPALETGITAAEIRSLIGVDASGSDNSTNVTLAGSYDYLTLSGQAITLGQITNDDLAGSIADSKLNQISTAGKVALSSLEIDGATDIGAAITDSDLIIIDDGGGGTNRKAAVSRLKTYIESSTSTSIDDLSDGKSRGTNFDYSMILGHETTGTLNIATANTAVGINAMKAITEGDMNTALGYDVFLQLTTGQYNTAIGARAMHEIISGTYNTAIGTFALGENKTGNYNTAIGYKALTNTTAGYNTAIGYQAGDVITTGFRNTLIGMSTDPSANNGSDQIVIGYGATGQGDDTAVIGNADVTAVYMAQDAGATVYAEGLNLSGTAVSSTAAELNLLDGGTSVGSSITIANSDGIIINDGGTMKTIPVSDLSTYTQTATSLNDLTDVLTEDNSLYVGSDPSSTTSNAQYNVAVGTRTLDVITTGDYNTAVGYDALSANTTGDYNTAVGRLALDANLSGITNTAVGHQALKTNTTGGYNTALGTSALNFNTTGSRNTAAGVYALINNTSGEYNTGMGYEAGDVIITGSNNTIIGYGADPSASNASNQIVIGKGATGQGDNYAVIGNADVTRVYAAQDGAAVLYANATINSSDMRLKDFIKPVNLGLQFINKLNPVSYLKISKSQYKGEEENNETRYEYGLIAQEVDKILKESDPENTIVSEDNEGFLGMDYKQIIMPLIKSVQELTVEIEKIKKELELLKQSK